MPNLPCFFPSHSKSFEGGVGKALKQMLKQHAGQTLTLLATPLKVLVQIESSGTFGWFVTISATCVIICCYA